MRQDVGDAQLYYEIHGDPDDDRRPWLIFSHSLACHIGMWTPQLAEFSRRYRVLAFDTRGHGRSDAPPGPYTMELLAEDLHRLLAAHKIARAHFVGLSMGGMIGQTYALAHPGVFISLTLADTTSRWPPEALQVFADRARTALEQGMAPLVAATLGRWFTPPFHQQHPAEVARIGEMIAGTPVLGYAGCCAAIPRINTTDRLHEIACPILVIAGKDDQGTPVAMSHAIAENAPGSELVIIESASHLSNVEQPQIFNQALSRFLERCDS